MEMVADHINVKPPEMPEPKWFPMIGPGVWVVLFAGRVWYWAGLNWQEVLLAKEET